MTAQSLTETLSCSRVPTYFVLIKKAFGHDSRVSLIIIRHILIKEPRAPWPKAFFINTNDDWTLEQNSVTYVLMGNHKITYVH